MTKMERFAMVKKMDAYVLDEIGDEDIIFSWLMCGCPDQSSDDDYMWFAEDADEFHDLCELFFRLVRRDDGDPQESADEILTKLENWKEN